MQFHISANTQLHNKKVNHTNSSTDRYKQINIAKVETKNSSATTPFHLSMCVDNLEKTRHFYKDILGIEERRATKSSAHFNFYGCQLTFHEIPGYTAENIEQKVEAENVPVPHFGAALTFEEFERIKERLTAFSIDFIVKPHLRFISKGHEQHVMFVKDPSGHGIEIKSFTKVPYGDWA